MFRSNCCRLSRVLLVSAVISSVVASSAVGEAFVLHQHGARRAHLHVLSSGELLSNAAFSATFGHSGRGESDWQGPGPPGVNAGVRTLCIIPTGLIATSTPRDQTPECSSTSLQDCPLARLLDGEGPAAIHPSSCPIQQSRSASALLLLRNHILLI